MDKVNYIDNKKSKEKAAKLGLLSGLVLGLKDEVKLGPVLGLILGLILGLKDEAKLGLVLGLKDEVKLGLVLGLKDEVKSGLVLGLIKKFAIYKSWLNGCLKFFITQ